MEYSAIIIAVIIAVSALPLKGLAAFISRAITHDVKIVLRNGQTIMLPIKSNAPESQIADAINSAVRAALFNPVSEQTTSSWENLRVALRERCGETAYRRWLEQIEGAVSVDANGRAHMTLTLPTLFVREWVEAHYGDIIRALFQHQSGGNGTITFAVKPIPNVFSKTKIYRTKPEATKIVRGHIDAHFESKIMKVAHKWGAVHHIESNNPVPKLRGNFLPETRSTEWGKKHDEMPSIVGEYR